MQIKQRRGIRNFSTVTECLDDVREKLSGKGKGNSKWKVFVVKAFLECLSKKGQFCYKRVDWGEVISDKIRGEVCRSCRTL